MIFIIIKSKVNDYRADYSKKEGVAWRMLQKRKKPEGFFQRYSKREITNDS
ncbi:hypothetical protein KCQ_11900 [Pectobacterium atrosepticum ICMP 1526]|nr:hypothetical protein KCQ_11900 [Pectobacterium atrosepticum ICMP 1526]